jgi:hypothetical protein
MYRFKLVVLVLALALALALTSSASAQDLSDEERKDGFVSMFNGKDFTGWRFSGGKKDELPKNWAVADGLIRLSGGGSPHLASEWDYEDFDVRLQWKAHKKGYNSGFYVRSGRSVNANQINLAQNDCGHLLGGPKEAKAVPELQKEPGEWNDWRVLAIGSKLTFWANGKMAWEINSFKPSRGYLGLQAEGHAVDFKNIRIKELGYESLNDLAKWAGSAGTTIKAEGEGEGEAIAVEGKQAQMVTKKAYKNYVLRLEYKTDKIGTLRLGFRNALMHSLRDAKKDAAKSAEHPAGQWNYLELRVQNNRSAVWLNGVWLWEDEPLPQAAAESCVGLGNTAEEHLVFRNLRIKDLEDLPKDQKK